jgi:1-phosphofructokinase family hexose kinase
VLVVGANLAVDRTLRMHRLEPGAVQRPYRASATAGGKAVNVCRAATALGVRPRLVANLPGRAGTLIGDLLDEEGHDVRRVPTAGEARAAMIILEDSGRATVINEPGPELSGADLAAFVAAVQEELIGHRVAVVTGSLPPHAPPDLYGRLAQLVTGAGSRIVLDASREALRQALPYEPSLVTPNLAEARAVLEGSVTSEPDTAPEPVVPEGDDVPAAAVAAAKELLDAGALAALVTAGRYGAAGASGTTRFWVTAPAVEEANPIGAGDAFAAGLAVALERGDELAEAAALGVATAAASVAHPLAGMLDPDLLARLLPRVHAEDA